MNAGMATQFASAFDKEMFMKLLVAELKNQNPAEPMSNSELVQQISALTQVESMNNLSAGFGEMLKLQRLTGGAQLIGREVEYLTESGTTASGFVQSINTVDGEIEAVVDGEEVKLDKITRIL